MIAASLLTPAYLYLWDEPLNYIDVFSRMQIEKLIAQFQPTMLIVEHDARLPKAGNESGRALTRRINGKVMTEKNETSYGGLVLL